MTDKKTEALKLALERLETAQCNDPEWQDGYYEEAITAIKEALAEQPAHAQTIKDQEAVIHRLQKRYADLEAKVGTPWVGLTEEDIEAAMPGGIYDCLADPWDCGVGDGDYMRSIKNDVVRIVRAIEAKLKEKNT